MLDPRSNEPRIVRRVAHRSHQALRQIHDGHSSYDWMTMAILPVGSLDATALRNRLQRLETDRASPAGLAANVLAICAAAAARLKMFPAVHGQFTLHDETHCLRVVELMG
jgi:hypothetical protein